MEQQSQKLDIRRYIRLLYRRRYLVIFAALAIITVAVVVGAVLPPVYEAKTVVLIQRNFINQLIKDITVTPSTEDRLKVLSVVMKSRALLVKVVGELGFEAGAKGPEDVEKLVASLQNRTEITVGINKANRRDMDAFAVSFRDRDPKLAMVYVNTLVKRYIEENATSKREETYGASRFLTDQINFFKKKIDTVEEQIGTQGATLLHRQAALIKRLEGLSTQYTDQHPEVVKVKGEIEALREQIRKGAGRAGTAHRPGRAASDGEAQTAGGTKKFNDLERERDAYKKIYEDLVATLGRSEVSTHVEAQDTAGAFRIVDPAILPAKPVGPDRVKIVLLGIVGGIAGAFGLALFLDSQDDSVRTIDALKGLGVPVLAVIPKIQSTREISISRRKDALVYGLSGVYLLGILTLFALMKAPG